jgi:hypothetical protein
MPMMMRVGEYHSLRHHLWPPRVSGLGYAGGLPASNVPQLFDRLSSKSR